MGKDPWKGGGNGYSYVLNNPIRYVDPFGRQHQDVAMRGGGSSAGAAPPPPPPQTGGAPLYFPCWVFGSCGGGQLPDPPPPTIELELYQEDLEDPGLSPDWPPPPGDSCRGKDDECTLDYEFEFQNPPAVFCVYDCGTHREIVKKADGGDCDPTSPPGSGRRIGPGPPKN